MINQCNAITKNHSCTGKSLQRARAVQHLGSTAGGALLKEGDETGRGKCAHRQPFAASH